MNQRHFSIPLSFDSNEPMTEHQVKMLLKRLLNTDKGTFNISDAIDLTDSPAFQKWQQQQAEKGK